MQRAAPPARATACRRGRRCAAAAPSPARGTSTRSLSISASAWPMLPSASGAACARVDIAVVVIAHQRRGHLGRRQPAEPQPHAARSHRRQQHARHRRRQDEHRARRRLFERLEQRVLRTRSRACRLRGSAPRGAGLRTGGSRCCYSTSRITSILIEARSSGSSTIDVDVHAAGDAIAGAALAAGIDRPGRVGRLRATRVRGS